MRIFLLMMALMLMTSCALFLGNMKPLLQHFPEASIDVYYVTEPQKPIAQTWRYDKHGILVSDTRDSEDVKELICLTSEDFSKINGLIKVYHDQLNQCSLAPSNPSSL